jgi:hypothetical protein
MVRAWMGIWGGGRVVGAFWQEGLASLLMRQRMMPVNEKTH